MVGAIFIGLIAGWLTGKIIRGQGYGVVMDIVLGLLGGVFGGLIFHLFGLHAYSYSMIGSLVVSTAGAAGLVILTRLIRDEI